MKKRKFKKMIFTFGALSLATVVGMSAVVAACSSESKNYNLKEHQFDSTSGTLYISYDLSSLRNKLDEIQKEKDANKRVYDSLKTRFSFYEQIYNLMLKHEGQITNISLITNNDINSSIANDSMISFFQTFYGLISDRGSVVDLSVPVDPNAPRPTYNQNGVALFSNGLDPVTLQKCLEYVFNPSPEDANYFEIFKNNPAPAPNPNILQYSLDHFYTLIFHEFNHDSTDPTILARITQYQNEIKNFVPDLQHAIIYWSLRYLAQN